MAIEVFDQIDEEDTQKDKFLTFNLGNEAYGIEIKYVTEIIGLQPITLVPELPSYVKGIINLRGKIIPVIDVRIRFKKEMIAYNDRTCVIIIEIDNLCVGLVVDAVAEVISITEENITPPPNISQNSMNRYIKGIGKVGDTIKLLLDCANFLNESELELCNSMV